MPYILERLESLPTTAFMPFRLYWKVNTHFGLCSHFTVLKAHETSFWDEKDPENCLQSTFLVPFLLFSWIYCDYKCFRYHTAGTLRESSMIHIHLRNTLCLIARTLEFKCQDAPDPFFSPKQFWIRMFWSFHHDNLLCARGKRWHIWEVTFVLHPCVSLWGDICSQLLLNYSTIYDKLSWNFHSYCSLIWGINCF